MRVIDLIELLKTCQPDATVLMNCEEITSIGECQRDNVVELMTYDLDFFTDTEEIE